MQLGHLARALLRARRHILLSSLLLHLLHDRGLLLLLVEVPVVAAVEHGMGWVGRPQRPRVLRNR